MTSAVFWAGTTERRTHAVVYGDILGHSQPRRPRGLTTPALRAGSSAAGVGPGSVPKGKRTVVQLAEWPGIPVAVVA
jgi:hypothetical protein